MPRTNAVVFDMDGVLVDSEPIWRATHVDTFARFGIDFTIEMGIAATGSRFTEVVARHAPDRSQQERNEIERMTLDGVAAAIRDRGRIMPGVIAAIESCRSRGVAIAIASGSPYEIIDAVIDRLGLADAFDVIHSAQDEELGKPDPAVYLTTASKLGASPTNCIAIEDSVAGVQSALAAGYVCVAVPDPELRDDESFDSAQLKLDSLQEFDDSTWELLQSLD